MKAWEIDILCPLCGIKTRLNKLQRHRNRKHPEYSLDEYESLIEKHIKDGMNLVDTKRVVTSHADATATKALIEKKKYTKKITSVVSGGAFGMGKNH